MKLGILLALTLSMQLALADERLADNVIVSKSLRTLYLMRGGEVLSSYDIALGLAPAGHKQREGDFRTPEGAYSLTRRLVDSDFFMAIEVSYPNAADVDRARRLGANPGGSIMIHGQPDEPKNPSRYYANFDWTDGCIAVSNQAMTEIWQLTRLDTPITILP